MRGGKTRANPAGYGEGKRLCQCGPGNVLEPWVAFCEREAFATIIFRSRRRTMVMTTARRERLESDDNELTLTHFALLMRIQSACIALFPPAQTRP